MRFNSRDLLTAAAAVFIRNSPWIRSTGRHEIHLKVIFRLRSIHTNL